MAIYTKRGDDGSTGLFNGKRVMKNNLIIETIGLIDELSSHIGLMNSYIKSKYEKKLFTDMQKKLYLIMSYISGAKVSFNEIDVDVKKFEQLIDKLSSQLPNLKWFILPLGSKTTSLFHILRTKTRTCERMIVNYFIKLKSINNKNEKSIIMYLNRLSDLFFTFARKYSKTKEISI